MYNYGGGIFDPTETTQTTINIGGSASVWVIVSIILAIIGGIVAYFLYIKKDVHTDNKYLIWAKEFFSFKKMLIEDLLKVLYLIFSIFITLSSFALIGVSFVSFLLTLVLGNLILRLGFEGTLVLIMIWKNTNEINSKMNEPTSTKSTTKKK